jgi:hypothetical protein
MSMLLDPRGVQSMPMGGFPNAGTPSIMDAPQVPQQQMQQANFGQRFKQNMGPILQALGMGIASNNLAAGTAALPVLADRRRQGMLEQQELAQKQQQLNMTKEWLKQKGRMDLVPLVDAGQADVALRIATDKGTEGPASVQEYEFARQNGFQGSYMDFKKNNSGGDGSDYFGTAVYGKGPDGKQRVGQLGKNGSIKWLDTAGVDLAPGVEKIDAGTEWLLIDRSGAVVGRQPKDLRGAEREKAIGGAQGEASVAAPKDIQAGQNALDLIDSIRNDPAKSRGTGMSSVFNNIRGTAGYGFEAKVEQAKSGAFLTAINQMRGMGALSNAEGTTATAAVTRMQTAMSEADFDAALADYEKIVRQGMERAQNTMNGGGGAPSGASGNWSVEEVQ